jgi:hypothetical protein
VALRDAHQCHPPTLDRNGTKDELTIHAPDGSRMLCVALADEADIPEGAQLKADAALICKGVECV